MITRSSQRACDQLWNESPRAFDMHYHTPIGILLVVGTRLRGQVSRPSPRRLELTVFWDLSILTFLATSLLNLVATGDGWWEAITEGNSPNGQVLQSRDGRKWEFWNFPNEISTSRGLELYDTSVGDGWITAVGCQHEAHKHVIATWPLDGAAGPKSKYDSTRAPLIGIAFLQGNVPNDGLRPRSQGMGVRQSLLPFV